MDPQRFVLRSFGSSLTGPISDIWTVTADPLFYLHHAVRHAVNAIQGNVLTRTADGRQIMGRLATPSPGESLVIPRGPPHS